MRLLFYSDLETAYDDPERMGRLAGTIRALRDGDAVVVGAGDDIAPGVLALVTGGRQALAFFEAVEPDAETVGNHDFDVGTDALRRIVRDSPQTWLGANVREGGSPFAGVRPWTVVERDGERVGLVGVSDPASSIPPSLTVTDPVAAVETAVDDLRGKGVERVVVLAHLRDGPMRAVAESAPVDAVLCGHVHDACRERVDGTLVLRPGASGRILWEVDLDGGVTATEHRVPEGPLAPAVADAFRDLRADAGLDEVVATLDTPIPRRRESCFAGTCPILDLITDAYRRVATADIGYVDTRALRSGPPLDGAVTAADLVGLVPFEADLHRATLAGDDLLALLRNAAATDERAGRSPREVAWWGYASGVRVVWNADDGAIERVVVGGDPLDPADEYTVATTDYVVGSGEFPAVSSDDVVATWGVQYEAVTEHAREHGIDPEPDGWIDYAEDGRYCRL